MLRNIIHSKIVKSFQSVRKRDWWRCESWTPEVVEMTVLQFFDLCVSVYVFTPFGTSTGRTDFISCVFLEQWVTKQSCPVVLLIRAQASDHDGKPLTPWHFYNVMAQVLHEEKNFTVKILWLRFVMIGWLLSPPKSWMSHLKSVLWLLHHDRFTTDNPFWTRASGLCHVLQITEVIVSLSSVTVSGSSSCPILSLLIQTLLNKMLL